MIQKHVYHKLAEEFCPTQLWVIDESHKHAGHAGAKEGAHIKVIMVTDRFLNLGRLQRHRLIYTCLGDLKADPHPIHALGLRLFTEEEWQNSPLRRTMKKNNNE